MRYIYILIILFSVATSSAQIFVPKDEYVPEIRQSRYSLAICLISSVNSSGVSFGIMRQNPDSTHEIIFLTKGAFIRQSSGNEKSKGNTSKINYFEENDLNVELLDTLWKLKYDTDPFGKESGWGTKNGTPSKAQFRMLNKFGIYNIRDYVFADNLWLFLQKVNDPAWVSQYKNLAGQ